MSAASPAGGPTGAGQPRAAGRRFCAPPRVGPTSQSHSHRPSSSGVRRDRARRASRRPAGAAGTGSPGAPWSPVGRKNSIHRPFLLPGRVKSSRQVEDGRGVSMIRWAGKAIAAWAKPRTDLIVENLCLRQQLIVLQRRVPRPRLRDGDRRFWILVCRWFPTWRDSLLVVQPNTVLRWHRRGWTAYWRWRSRPRMRGGRPPLQRALRALIRRMSVENRLWGQRRVQAELARLGFPVSARTVAKYMRQAL